MKMKPRSLYKRISICLAVLLIPAVLASFTACGKAAPDSPVPESVTGEDKAGKDVANHPGAEDNIPGYPSGYAGEGEPDSYAVALNIKVRSEFIIYVTNDQIVQSYLACNDEAKQILDHTLLSDHDLFTCVHDIFLVSIDDLDVDTEREEILITLVDSNITENETAEFMQVARDAANEAITERNKKGDAQSIIPQGIEFVQDPATGAAGDPGREEALRAEDSEFFDTATGQFICSSQSDIDTLLEYTRKVDPYKTNWTITIDKDVSLEINATDYSDITFNLDGHNISISGTFTYVSEEYRLFRIENASSVDLSSFIIDLESAKNIPQDYNPRDDPPQEEAYWNPQRKWVSVVEIINTDPGSIILPADTWRDDGPNENFLDDPRYFSIFDPYIAYRGESGRSELCLVAPLEDYEVRQEKEKEVLSNIFQNGEYHSLTGQTSNNFYYICTEVTLDIGDCKLPNMDYETINVGKGGKVILTGTLYVTGGVFRIHTWEKEGVDLRGLTIVKKHPSPDMIWISYDPGVGINADLCRCNTASGTIKYSDGGSKIAITVW